MSQFREGLRKGFRVFSLLGTDLGPYGIDLGFTLADLLEEIISEKEDFKIGLRNVNPFFLRKMLDKFSPILTSKKLWYLGTAAESGINRKIDVKGHLSEQDKLINLKAHAERSRSQRQAFKKHLFLYATCSILNL